MKFWNNQNENLKESKQKSKMTSTHEMISDSEAYTNENDTFSEGVTNTTNISLTLSAAKPAKSNKFGRFLSGMSGTMSHSKSSNDIHSHKISGSVAMSVNAASQYNILNIPLLIYQKRLLKKIQYNLNIKLEII